MKCGELKVILGCGMTKKEGWIGLDKGDYGQEIVKDMLKGLPFCDNSCVRLEAESVLEHIQLTEDYVFLMNECLRVLKSGGQFEISVPVYDNETAFKDPTHSRFFTKHTFTYLIPSNRWEYGFDKRWKIIKNEVNDSQIHAILEAKK